MSTTDVDNSKHVQTPQSVQSVKLIKRGYFLPAYGRKCSRSQLFDCEKLHYCISQLTWNLASDHIDVDDIVSRVIAGLPNVLTTQLLAIQTATVTASLSTHHHDYSLLAGRIYVKSIHKAVGRSFSSWVRLLADSVPSALDPTFVATVAAHETALDDAIMHNRDYNLPYRSVQMLVRSYLFRNGAAVVERPQHAYMRVAVAIHNKDIEQILATYDALSRKRLTFSSPFMFNAGSPVSAYASCFLYQPSPTLKELLGTTTDLDSMWLSDGGIGLTVDCVPARRGEPQYQPGVLPLLRVYDSHAQYTSLARRHRSSAATVYIPIWHADVLAVIQSHSNRSPASDRLTRVFPAIWIPDIFMERLAGRETWSLFDPIDAVDLVTATPDEFPDIYVRYEQSSINLTSVPSTDIWDLICSCQRETGVPFILYADNINRKNNQQHIGIVRNSNLCTEIVQVSTVGAAAVCTLASIGLPACIESGTLNLGHLANMARLAVRSLDTVLDSISYPDDATRRNALSTRSIGVGVQGLADVFMSLAIPFDSPEASALNVQIFETVYHAALDASCDMAKIHGAYPSWEGSPASKGILQYDFWKNPRTNTHDFHKLRQRISAYGLRNSMLTAQMPTASTAQLLGNCEGVEPYTSNITTFRLLSGDFTEYCPWLVKALDSIGSWDEETRTSILRAGGSIQHLQHIPPSVRNIFKTAWEIDPRVLLEMATERGPYIDQSQSTSLHIANPTVEQMTALQFYAWQSGLKTGVYYTRTKPVASPLPFGLLPTTIHPTMRGYVGEANGISPSDVSDTDDDCNGPQVSCQACEA